MNQSRPILGLSDRIDGTAHDACLGRDDGRTGAAACLQLVNDVADMFFGVHNGVDAGVIYLGKEVRLECRL